MTKGLKELLNLSEMGPRGHSKLDFTSVVMRGAVKMASMQISLTNAMKKTCPISCGLGKDGKGQVFSAVVFGMV